MQPITLSFMYSELYDRNIIEILILYLCIT